MRFKLWIETSPAYWRIKTLGDLLVALDHLEEFPQKTSGYEFARFSVAANIALDNYYDEKLSGGFENSHAANQLTRLTKNAIKDITQYGRGVPPTYDPNKFDEIELNLNLLGRTKEGWQSYFYRQYKEFIPILKSLSQRYVTAFHQSKKTRHQGE